MSEQIGLHRSLCGSLKFCFICTIFEDTRDRLLVVLELPTSKKARGFALNADVAIGDVQLRNGDRLEPSNDLQYVFSFGQRELPFVATCWRPSADASGAGLDPIIHRNPLFSQELGTSPQQCLVIDSLHTVYYGPMMRWTSAVIWRIVLLNRWGVTGGIEAVAEEGCTILKENLLEWYEDQKIPFDRRVNELTAKMIGERLGCTVKGPHQHPGCMLKCKAAESSILFAWARSILDQYGSEMPLFKHLQMAGAALARWLAITREHPNVLPGSAVREIREAAQRHLLYSARALVGFVPKHHFFAELSKSTDLHGNPKGFATWQDESLNLKLRNAAAAAHMAHQEQRIFDLLNLSASLGLLPNVFGDAVVFGVNAA
jgi:hypothetical protein